MAVSDSIIAAESGGDPNAVNPRSSASGLGQFIDSTWLDTIKKARPDIADGKSDADLIGLKTDPQLSREMTEAYAKQNGEFLAKNGQSVTPGSTYLAHFAGPQGAVNILKADPNAPVEGILDASAIKSNSFLKGMTAQGLQAWAARKVGTSAPVAGVQNSAPQAAASPANAIPQQQQPIFPQQAQPQAPQAPQGQMPQSDAPEITPQRPQTNPIASFLAQLQIPQSAPPILSQPQKRIALQMASSRAPIF